MTEDEAEAAWDAALESYLDEIVLPDVPEQVRNYFDSDAWKRDARMDGRGHSLASYDGDETDVQDPETGDDFVVFRLN